MFIFLYKERWWTYYFPAKKTALWQTVSRQKPCVQLNVTFEMGPLHQTVTWYKNHLAGWQIAQWDLEKKGCELFEWSYIFVFLAPLRRLPFSKVFFFCIIWLYHAKSPLVTWRMEEKNVTIQLPGHISYSLCSMSVHIFFQGSIPFAVIGSNTITEVRGKQVRVRQYPWGMAEGLLIQSHSISRNSYIKLFRSK